MITKRQFSLGLCATGLTSSIRQPAHAQAGSRGARIMVGFGPGGALDVTARLLTTAMKDYASPFIVENRPGASERIALEAVKSSAADGSTLLLTRIVLGCRRSACLQEAQFRSVTGFYTRHDRLQVPVPAHGRVDGARSAQDPWRFHLVVPRNSRQATYGTVGAGWLHHFIGVALSRAADRVRSRALSRSGRGPRFAGRPDCGNVFRRFPRFLTSSLESCGRS